MTLAELVASARTLGPDARRRVEAAGRESVVVTDVTHDSRGVSRGTVFVAIRGKRADGATFAAEAIRRGAVAIVSEQPILDTTVPWLPSTDVRLALSELAAICHGRPSERLTVVGVTGTNGKTTTAYLMASVL
ncbi:MAG: Mur ligase domain-containing protein, partial [Acidobacteriota bacterium]